MKTLTEKILIVEDEREIADLIELYLKNENFDVHKFYNPKVALECIKKTEFDLAILDIMLPGINGLSICQTIRSRHTYPIIMLTAKDAETDKITGLTLGADDYITKPFRPLELTARVKAQLRRYKKYNGGTAKADDGIIVHSGLVINTNSRECLMNGIPLTLTPTEFSILRILCENKGNVVSSEKLFHEIWGDEYFSKSNNTITVHIRNLREKMNDSENPRYIKTVWGVGYKIEG
jgi:two-component system response regulator VanR